jgi:hypothetical protein
VAPTSRPTSTRCSCTSASDGRDGWCRDSILTASTLDIRGLPSSLSRNLWDDWNESDANFQVKFDMFNGDDVASTTSTAPSSVAAISPGAPSGGALMDQSPHHESANTHPRALVERSLSEDIVSMLDDGGDLVLTPSSNHARPSNDAGSGMSHNMLPPQAPGGVASSRTSFMNQQMVPPMHHQQQQQHHHQQRQQQQQQQQQLQQQQQQHQQQQQQQQQQQPQFQQFQQMQQMQMQQLQQQLQMQQQFQQMQQQRARASDGSNWMDAFTTSASNGPMQSEKSSLENAVAAASSTLTAMPHGAGFGGNHTPSPHSSSERSPATQQQQQFNMSPFGFQTPSDSSSTSGQKRKAEGDAPMSEKLKNKSTPDTSGSTPGSVGTPSTPDTASTSSSTPTSTGMNGQQQNGGSFGNPAMMMPGFMMYPMPMMGNYNALGMNGMNMMQMGAMQMPMGAMQMPGMGMNGMPMGMPGVNGMQMSAMGIPGMGMNPSMPMSAMGMPLGMQMPSPMGFQVNPQSGVAGDVDMGSSTSPESSIAPAPTPIAMRSLQPKDANRVGGPGFVSIARKPEEPEVSSILKSLMEEEAKKKEKKLERNRDSARESRKKQQTYVETLENGIKRLQINRDLVVSYKWGLSGPGFGPLPCPNSPQMFDWKNRVQVVTGQSEAFSNIQNPTTFRALMQLNRQRRVLVLRTDDRARAVWKCFVAIGQQLEELRRRILQVQLLRVFTQNTLAGEVGELLHLSADQKLQLQCLAQTSFNEEVVQMVALFKVFFALRNEALRLNLMSPALESYFRESCSVDQLHRLLQFSEMHRSVIEDALASSVVPPSGRP